MSIYDKLAQDGSLQAHICDFLAFSMHANRLEILWARLFL